MSNNTNDLNKFFEILKCVTKDKSLQELVAKWEDYNKAFASPTIPDEIVKAIQSFKEYGGKINDWNIPAKTVSKRHWVESHLDNSHFPASEIFSVSNSKGEVFAEKYSLFGCGSILEFHLKNGKLTALCTNGIENYFEEIDSLRKPSKPVIETEDDVEIVFGKGYWTVSNDSFNLLERVANENNTTAKHFIWFSEKKLALDYINYHSKKYSLSDNIRALEEMCDKLMVNDSPSWNITQCDRKLFSQYFINALTKTD